MEQTEKKLHTYKSIEVIGWLYQETELMCLIKIKEKLQPEFF